MAIEPSSLPLKLDKDPQNLPMGVRAMAQMTTFDDILVNNMDDNGNNNNNK